MLVDDTGKPLQGTKTKEQVMEILEKLAPKNKEEERILAQKIGQSIEANRKAKVEKGIDTGFDGLFQENLQERVKGDSFTKERTMRRIASIPKEMVYIAESIWGPNVLTDPVLFREAFVKDETGQFCLTVDPKTI